MTTRAYDENLNRINYALYTGDFTVDDVKLRYNYEYREKIKRIVNWHNVKRHNCVIGRVVMKPTIEEMA